MNDLPRRKLREIIVQYGSSICDDPRRCEALLKDFCAGYPREISALVTGIREQVAADLLVSRDSVPHELLLTWIINRLCDNHPIAVDAARWAVESWALALGVVSEEIVADRAQQDNARSVSMQENRPSPILHRCGNCRALQLPENERCTRCGTKLRAACPRCGTVNPSDAQYCSKSECGLALGDLPQVEQWIREARLKLKANDLATAKLLLGDALTTWPAHTDAQREMNEVNRRLDELETIRVELKKALNEQRFHAALDTAERLLKTGATATSLNEIMKRINESIEVARRLCAQGSRLLAARQTEEAFDKFSAALAACTDHQPAQQGLLSCPPIPPSELSTICDSSGVQLRWRRSPSKGRVKYEVLREVRFPNGRGPESITTINEPSYNDSTCIPGQLVIYLVASVRDGVRSIDTAQTSALLITAEARGVTCTPGDGQITIQWQLPENALGVEIWREEGTPPSKLGQGVRVAVSATGHLVDSGLVNGVVYGYRIATRFATPDGSIKATPGLICQATPFEPLKPISDLSLTPDGESFVAEWTPPPRGEVWIYLASSQPSLREGSVLTTSQAHGLGRALSIADRRRCAFRPPGRGAFFVLPLTVEGSNIVLGRWLECSWVDDVRNVRASVHGHRVTLRWDWPVEIEAVAVVRRKDRFPAGPVDPDADKCECSKFQYEQHQGFTFQAPDTDILFVAVYASVTESGRTMYSTGASPDHRRQVILGKRHRVEYKVVHPRKLPRILAFLEFLYRQKEPKLVLKADDDVSLPNLVLVGNEGRRPVKPTDGIRVKEIPEGTPCQRDVPVSFTLDKATPAMKFRLFAEDQADYQWFEFMGPILSMGETY